MTTDHDRRLERLEEQFTKIISLLATLEERTININKRLDGIDTRLNNLTILLLGSWVSLLVVIASFAVPILFKVW